MTRGARAWVLAAFLAAAFLWGVVSLFDRQFAAGELYPQFSSMRTDRMGAKLLYDSLATLPGVTVERNFLPMDFLPRDGATLVLLGLHPADVNWNDGMLLQSVDRIAGRGNRVVLAMYVDPENESGLERLDDRGEKKSGKPGLPQLRTMWGVTLKLDGNRKADHPLYFADAPGWHVRASEGGRLLSIERDSGKGSILLMAESGSFTNASVVNMDGLAELSAALGPYRRIVFDEQHLGVAESGSIVGMARQFHLMGLALGLALCAALFIWKNASGFPPPVRSPRANRFSGRTSHAGLVTLLKRHVPPGELAAVCWKEWLSTNRGQVAPEVRERAEAIVAGAAGRPVEAAREIQTLLNAKGEL
jgi:hypothetical protein